MDPTLREYLSYYSDLFQTEITGIPQDEIFSEIRQRVGSVPGDGNGPFDAARHLARASIFYSEHPGILANDSIVDLMLNGREAIISGTNSGMDYHNNQIGKQIGIYAREHHLTRAQTYDLCAEVIQKSFGGAIDLTQWKKDENGILHSPQETITLSNGLVLPTVVVMPQTEWLEVDRPVVLHPSPDATDMPSPGTAGRAAPVPRSR